MLAARALLALVVAWGAGVEMTRPSSFANTMLLAPPFRPPAEPGVAYTLGRYRTTIRGWPVTFSSNPGLPQRLSVFETGIRPAALACDLIVLAVLTVGAWRLLGPCRFRFDLADICSIILSITVTLSLHLVTWDRQLELSQIAVGLGVFSGLLTGLRLVRGFFHGSRLEIGPHVVLG
ncbi:MAG: hypothetical protein ABSG86_31055 [Thermoguttaceae bacterium]|jgi:hypothetical protein